MGIVVRMILAWSVILGIESHLGGVSFGCFVGIRLWGNGMWNVLGLGLWVDCRVLDQGC